MVKAWRKTADRLTLPLAFIAVISDSSGIALKIADTLGFRVHFNYILGLSVLGAVAAFSALASCSSEVKRKVADFMYNLGYPIPKCWREKKIE